MRDRPPVAAAIVLAGGSGTRFGAGRNKVYLPLGGHTVVHWSLRAFAAVPGIGPVVLVIRPEDRDAAGEVLAGEVGGPVELVVGGASRHASELAGLRHVAARVGDGTVDVVLLHDAARPLVAPPLIANVLVAARVTGGAVPGLPRDDLVAVTADGTAVAGPADGLVAVQTPQAFRAPALLAAYEEAERHGFTGTDTASCVERFAPDLPVRWVRGDERNVKITYAHDLVMAERVLAGRSG